MKPPPPHPHGRCDECPRPGYHHGKACWVLHDDGLPVRPDPPVPIDPMEVSMELRGYAPEHRQLLRNLRRQGGGTISELPDRPRS